MNLVELKEYLSIVVDMEKSIFLQNDLLANLQMELEKLKKPLQIVDPIKPVRQPVIYSEKPPEKRTTTKPIPSLFLCALAGVILFCFAVGVGFILRAKFFVLAGGIIAPVVPFVYRSHCKAKSTAEQARMADAEYQRNKWNSEQKQIAEAKADAEYETQLKEYQQKIEENKFLRQQDETERMVRSAYFQKEKNDVEQNLSISKHRLENIYAKNIIFPKYRNLIMVCSLYEYICAGRCSELEGHEGAYNILEMEIRLDRIIVQLDRIIVQFEAIKQNQFMLYTVIQESNQLLKKLLVSTNCLSVQISSSTSHLSSQIAESSRQVTHSLNDFHGHVDQLNSQIAELQKTSELTAYYTERSQKELAYMNRMNYFSGRNDDVFWNVPPT